MSGYTISNKELNPSRVFILQKSELEKRRDPNTYHPERRSIIEALKKSGHLIEPLQFVYSFKKSIAEFKPLMIKLVERNKIDAVQGNITIPTIRNFPLVLLTPYEQQKIADHITGIRQQTQQLKDKTNDALKKAREGIEKILLG